MAFFRRCKRISALRFVLSFRGSEAELIEPWVWDQFNSLDHRLMA